MSQESNALPNGCRLQEYRIESVLGTGGFGITYKAQDTHLDTWVAIKEYFPIEWSYRGHDGISVNSNAQGQMNIPEVKSTGYQWGLTRFLDEARVLARVQHPYVVRVRRYFCSNGTAYFVMDYEEGEPLSALLKREEILSEEDLRGLLEEVLPALEAVHQQGYLHRDLKPSNLYIRARDNCVMLIDFGAARQSLSQRSKSVTGLVTPGYSPPEQYVTRNDRYGPWTDIYALGAVLYRCVTGNTPTEAPDRQMWDTLVPAVEAGAGRYNQKLLEVIDRALKMRPEDRFQSIAEMQTALVLPAQLNSDQSLALETVSLPADNSDGSGGKSNSLLPPFRSRLLKGKPEGQDRFESSLSLIKPDEIAEKPELELDPPSLKPLSAKSQKESQKPSELDSSVPPPFKPKSRRLQDAVIRSLERTETESLPVSSGSEAVAAGTLSLEEPEFHSLLSAPKLSFIKQRDIILLIVLVALLGTFGGLVFNIYRGYQNSLTTLQQGQVDQEAETARRAAQEQAQSKLEKSRQEQAVRFIEQARTALSHGEFTRVKNYLDQAESLNPRDEKIMALRQALEDAKDKMPSVEIALEPRIDMKLVRIKGGCFQMGSSETQTERYSNESQHQVCVKDFWLGQYEITNDQYRRFRPDHDSGTYSGETLNSDQQPVVEVSWEDAVAYAQWLSEQTGKHYRLPTEAEWEYAARAETGTVRYWGNESVDACRYANVADETGQRKWAASSIHNCNDGHGVAAPVGSYEPNAFKLYDMLGNVSEWTCSEYDPEYRDQESRCSRNEMNNGRRTVRGGSWDDPPRFVRSTDRNGREPSSRDNDLGFRLLQEG